MKTEIYKKGFVEALKEELFGGRTIMEDNEMIDIIDKLSKEYKIKNEN